MSVAQVSDLDSEIIMTVQISAMISIYIYTILEVLELDLL